MVPLKGFKVLLEKVTSSNTSKGKLKYWRSYLGIAIVIALMYALLIYPLAVHYFPEAPFPDITEYLQDLVTLLFSVL